MRVIGLMSGTSADAVDAALVRWPETAEARPFLLEAAVEVPHDAELQRRIHALAAGEVPRGEALRELAALDAELGDCFAQAAQKVAREAGVSLHDVRAIASHGQTVAHHPELGSSLQIGNPARIAARTGCDVVSDFRSGDLAEGGEGAPLAPFFHWAVMRDDQETRAVLNLGGIANLTWLPRGGDRAEVVAFDVGPANSLTDGVIQLASAGDERMDRDGEHARRGRVDSELLDDLLSDPFFTRLPPKSTGREHYGSALAAELWQRSQRDGRSLDDLVATLVALTATSVARACEHFLPEPIERLLVGGGGVRNPAVMAALAAGLPNATVDPFDAVGVPAAAAEAMAFSLLGRNTLLRQSNHLPGTTGARCEVLLGSVTPGGRVQ